MRQYPAAFLAAVACMVPFLSASAAPPPPPTILLVAFTRHNNVYVMSTSGTRVRAITTRGTGYPGIAYPAYSWSPDGKYLLLVREYTKSGKADLLLLNSSGKVMRTLATGIPGQADFWPGWAIDADQIAFVAGNTNARHRVERVDTSGHQTFLFSYASSGGCGGGSDNPSEIAYWNEVGYEGNRPAISWSVKQHLAAYASGCGGGVNVTNTQTGATGTNRAWNDPALSSRGTLAVLQRTTGASRTSLGTLVLVDPGSGAIQHRAGVGELPSWTPDGRTLFFVRRSLAQTLRARDALGNAVALAVYRSAIVEAWGNGTHQQTLVSADAYAFGSLNVLRGNLSLVFSQIDNPWKLWNARRNGVLPATTPASGAKYIPGIKVLRLDIGRAPATLATNATSPAAP